MSYLRFAGLFGNFWSRKATRRTRVTKRFTRSLTFLGLEQLEDRQLLAGILGTAEDFAVLGHTAVTNTGPTVVFGSADTLANVGVWEAGANAVSGFSLAGNTFYGTGTFTDGPGLVNAPAAIHGGDGVALNARNDLIAAYTILAGPLPSLPAPINLTGQILGNGVGGTQPTLSPGIYSFTSTTQLNGTLQLDAGGR